MNNATNTSSKTKSAGPTSPAQGMANMGFLQNGALKTALAMGSETAQFFAARMQQDMAAQRAIMACKTFEDLQKVQTDFYQTALEDYRCATERMMTILLNGSPANIASTKRGYDDVPL